MKQKVYEFSGPELERVLAYAERDLEGLPSSLRKDSVFYHVRAWASSRVPLPRGVDIAPIRPIELLMEQDKIVGVRVNV